MEENQTIKIDPLKFKLAKSFDEKLKLFLMYVRPVNVLPIPGEQIGAIIAYRDSDAIAKAMTDYPGKFVFFQGQSLLIEDLIKQVAMEGEAIELKMERPVGPAPTVTPQKLSKESFKAGLLMVIKEYATLEDQETLRKIIEKL